MFLDGELETDVLNENKKYLLKIRTSVLNENLETFILNGKISGRATCLWHQKHLLKKRKTSVVNKKIETEFLDGKIKISVLYEKKRNVYF